MIYGAELLSIPKRLILQEIKESGATLSPFPPKSPGQGRNRDGAVQ